MDATPGEEVGGGSRELPQKPPCAAGALPQLEEEGSMETPGLARRPSPEEQPGQIADPDSQSEGEARNSMTGRTTMTLRKRGR